MKYVNNIKTLYNCYYSNHFMEYHNSKLGCGDECFGDFQHVTTV